MKLFSYPDGRRRGSRAAMSSWRPYPPLARGLLTSISSRSAPRTLCTVPPKSSAQVWRHWRRGRRGTPSPTAPRTPGSGRGAISWGLRDPCPSRGLTSGRPCALHRPRTNAAVNFLCRMTITKHITAGANLIETASYGASAVPPIAQSRSLHCPNSGGRSEIDDATEFERLERGK
jgi:hypothetical protein